MSGVFTYLAQKQAALKLHPLVDLGKEKSAGVKQVDQAQSHLIAMQGELDAIKEKHRETSY